MGGMGSGGLNKITDKRLKATSNCFETVIWHDSAPRDWLTILNDLHCALAVSPLHDRDYYSRRNFADRPYLLSDYAAKCLLGDEKPFDSDGVLIEDIKVYCDWLLELRNEFELHGSSYFPPDDLLPLIHKKPHRHVIFDLGKKASVHSFIERVRDTLEELGINPDNDVNAVVNQMSMTRYLAHLDEDDKFIYNSAEIINLGSYNVQKYLDADAANNTDLRNQILDFAFENGSYSFSSVYDLLRHDDAKKIWCEYIFKNQSFFDRYFSNKIFKKDKFGDFTHVMSDNISSGNTNK